tara:strand:+ start:357 stop:2363 length:2007 start_codon:yes stop_codon:yes gene_type:complete
MTTIITKTEGVGDTAATEPASLTKGELAVNTQGGLLFHGNSSSATARFKATTLAGTNYSLFTVDDDNVVEIAPGPDGYVLTSTGTGSVPAWEAGGGGDITNVGVTAPVTGGGSSGSVTIGVSTAAVTNGSANLSTGDQIYDKIMSDYSTGGSPTFVALTTSSYFSMPKGSAASPGFRLSDDTNTGIYYDDVDTFCYSFNGTGQWGWTDGAIYPISDNDVDLGKSGKEWKDLFIDGTAHIDVLDIDTSLYLDGETITNIIDDSESFVDSDAHLMTAAAVDNRILSYGYSTSSSNFYLTGVTKSSNTLTFAVNGASDPTYTFGSNAFTSTTIPTNNNQLTNGAGYITSYTNTVDMGSGFVMEDGDGTEVTITEDKEVKFIGAGIDITWTNTSNGSDGDPYDLTFTAEINNSHWDGTDLAVNNGGTGRSTLTPNYVLLGNSTSAVQMIAPGSEGNVLTSNGTTWQSEAPAGGGGGDEWGDAVDAHIIPAADDTYDLGRAADQFRNGFFNGTLEADLYSIEGVSGAAGGTSAEDIDCIVADMPFYLNLTSTKGIVTEFGLRPAMSDIKYKENIADFTLGTDFIKSLPTPQTFDWKESSKEIGHKTAKKNQLGYVAQTLEVDHPKYVNTVDASDEEYDDFKQINYAMLEKDIIYSLVNTVKELEARIAALEAA